MISILVEFMTHVSGIVARAIALISRVAFAGLFGFVVFSGPSRVMALDSWVVRPTYAPAPPDNPLKGFVPYAGQGRDFPHSLEFGYLSLASIMTGPTDFNWTPMDQFLDGVASRGCQAIFRVYLEYPRKPSGMPSYLQKAGVMLRAWTNTNTQPFPAALDHTPDYEDPRLRTALKTFITALGARYDGDPRIGFITAGLLGTWGEWHCHPHSEWFASKVVQTEVMDSYQLAFKQTPVLLRYPAGDNNPVYAPNHQRNMGYHDDSFAWATLETGRKSDDWFFLAALRTAGPAALERWRSAPIGGEIRPELWPCLWKVSGCTQGQDFNRSVSETHVTWLMDSSTSRPLSVEERNRAVAASQRLGYELQITEAIARLSDQRLEIAVTLTNRGVAPFYANWPVQILAVNPNATERTATLPFQWHTLLPATSQTQSVSLELPNSASGQFEVFIGIPNPLPSGRPLRFANVEPATKRPGWFHLGSVNLQ